MKTREIKIHVDEELARVYQSSDEEQKRKLEALLSSRLREVIRRRNAESSLEQIINEMSHNAQKRGLTPEKLDDILNDQ